MFSLVNRVVLPGDELESLQKSEKTNKVVLGPGLYSEIETVLVNKPGILRFKEPNIYWVDCQQKRYVPARGENVIGIVTVKSGDIFRVDVGGSVSAALSYLTFEGATKRNRPDVKVGDLVHARFIVANKDMEPELTCIDGNGRASGMGVLRGETGFLLTTSLNLCRQILSPNCVLMKTLGKDIPFESVVGVNGRIWIKSRSLRETLTISNAIAASENMTNEQIQLMCRRLVDSLAGFTPEDMET